MTIATEFTVAVNGDIRHTGGATTHYTVIQLHRWLGDLMDDAQASGDDTLDITDATASERATDNLITLKSPYNIDDATAQYFYDGSIVQKNGDEIYDGLIVIAAQGMYLQIIQDGALVTNFWEGDPPNGYNQDVANGISHRFMLKVRTAGADIDGRRLIGTTRELGKTYSEFKINGTSRGNNVMALAYSTDLNNATDESTISGWTDITNTTEGYKLMDVDQNSVNEAYYSEWNKSNRTINQFYERMKWLTRRGTTSTLYGLDGDLFRGITHEVSCSGTHTGTFPAYGALTWTGGTGQLLAVDVPSNPTKMWIQLLTGIAPTNSQTITGPVGSGSPTATVSGTPLERPLSFPFIGVSTGSALIGAYGVGLETGDLSNLDKVFDLTNTYIPVPNQVQFSVTGLNYTASPGDRVLVGPLGYIVQYDGETSGPFVRGETLTFSGNVTGTAYLSELLDLGTTGFLKFRMLTGDPPIDNTAIAGGGGASAAAFGAAVASEDPRQLKLNTTLNSAGVTSIVCTSAIPTDTPSSGTLRIQLNTNIYRRVAYTSYSGSTFTIGSTDFSGANQATGGAGEAGNSIFVSYIDKNAQAASESFTSVYLANRDLFIRVRFGDAAAPIKTFESSGLLTGAGGSSVASRITDA
jgi:hypothetical protein